LAYEPVWAIGSGKVPTNVEILEVMSLVDAFVQNYLPHAKITTLYGGSVNALNIENILSIDKNGGVLVGSASLHPNEFSKICAFA
jgi:triosephosphate isomerase